MLFGLVAVWPLLLITELCLSANLPDINVNTTSGKLKGALSNGVYTYFGIPYAESPTGDRRFQPAVLKQYMGHVYDATNFGPVCPQVFVNIGSDYRFLFGDFNMTEDCLVLNVYAPQSPSHDNRKAVMVWIHGGGYTTGTGNTYDGTQLARLHDVIVITINYRIGILGFLNTMDENAPGNLGLRDQILALRWIQINVEEFGGDKNRVTLFGESAGAGSVTQLSLSPMSRGLFHRIIAESGSPFAPWSFVKNPFAIAVNLAKGLSCPTNATVVMVECMRDKPFQELLQFQRIVLTSDFTSSWGPTYGNEFFPFTEKELKNNFKNLSMACKLSEIDIIIGICSEEGALFYNIIMSVLREKLGINDEEDGISEAVFNDIISPLARALTSGSDGPRDFLLPSLKYRYTDWTRPNNGLARSTMIITLFTDVMFGVGSVEFARLHADLFADENDTGSGTYFFLFNQRWSGMTKNSWRFGADHGDDLFFVFGFPLTDQYNASAEEKKFSMDVMTYWTNFAKTGNPNQANSPVQWPQFSKTYETYLELSVNLSEESVKSRLSAKRIAFWTDFIPQQLRSMAQATSNCPLKLEKKVRTPESEYDERGWQ